MFFQCSEVSVTIIKKKLLRKNKPEVAQGKELGNSSELWKKHILNYNFEDLFVSL